MHGITDLVGITFPGTKAHRRKRLENIAKKCSKVSGCSGRARRLQARSARIARRGY